MFTYHTYKYAVVLSLSILLALLSACTVAERAKPQQSTNRDPAAGELSAVYAQAVRDASNPEPDEISHDLTSITAGNTDLIRRIIDDKLYILTATWATNTKYFNSVDDAGFYNTGKYNIWVTVVPELKIRCSDPHFGHKDLELRLKQLLGLPPTVEKEGFVEMWVRPEHLFRPCPDSEITDTRCDLNLPADTTARHRQWFNTLRAESYCNIDSTPEKAYPWTQLGYTYDWNQPGSEVGLSEFVIRKNVKIKIERNNISAAAYCAAP
jgi:hypothetical protein